MLSAYLFFSICTVVLSFVKAQYLPDRPSLIIKELEHLYLDAASSGLISAITPCTNYVDSSTGLPGNGLGRQTAAEWIRTAFHDFVTGSIYTLEGGLDASIGFETLRPENVGPAFNDSLTNFSYFFNAMVSMSDLIALGTVLAVGACGGPHVTLRGGRIDATQAGPSGVPEPETGISATLTQFGNAGFNTADTIILTACGHTMGGVHRSTFPQVVPASAVSPTDTDGRLAFDETVAVFDVDTVTDYVSGTGDKGGPLVTTTNVTVQSDLRLYTADQKVTMKALSQSAAYFASNCADVLQRMIETVPGGVILTNPIDPTIATKLQPFGLSLSIDWKGNMTLSGSFRYIQVTGSPTAPSSLTIVLINRAGKTTTITTTATTNLAQDTGTGIWGPTHAYLFTLSFPATTGLSGLNVSGQTFALQDSMFVVQTLSSVSPSPPAFVMSPSMNAVQTYTINTTVAYFTKTPPASLAATFAIPKAQMGSVSPVIDTSSTAVLNLLGKTTGGFALYSAVTMHSVSAKQAYGSSLSVGVAGQAPGVLFYKPFVVAQ